LLHKNTNYLSIIDLLLAAEIGKSLLEHNQNLKQNYEKLLQNVKQCESVTEQEREYDMRLISCKMAYDTIIESLEHKNAEIQIMLDQTNQHSTLTQKEYEKKQRKLESEIDILKSDLELAANKIHELEENNQLRQERWKRMDEIRGFEQQQKTDDLELLQELTKNLQELCIENKQLQSSKRQVEEKLVVSLRDLEKLRKQFEQFELTQQGYEKLQEAFERQTMHIEELNTSLEDHRQILSKLHEKGLYTPTTAKYFFRDGDNSSLFSSTVAKQSLMGELENAFNKKKAYSSRTRSHSDSSSDSFPSKIYNLATMTERNLTSFCKAPGDYALYTLLSSCGVRQSFLEEAEEILHSNDDSYSLFEPLMEDEEEQASLYANLYPEATTKSAISEQLLKQEQPKGLANRILFHIRYLFRSLFRWCRFAIILVTAVLINLWKGPDLLLEEEKQHLF
jgi:hypothetical protein